MQLTIQQIIYIAVASVIVLAGILCAIIIPIKHKSKKKEFRNYFYKKVYQIAFNEDYYLINKFTFKVENSKNAVIDHILFGNKYIYLITSLYYEGNLSGSYDDKSLKYTNKEGKKTYTDNPFTRSELLLQKVAITTGLDTNLLVGIVLVNDECNLDITSQSEQFFICQRRKLNFLIKSLEHKDVGDINEEQLAKAVKAIDKMNKKKRTK